MGGGVGGKRVRGDRVKRGLSGAVYHWAATYEDLYPRWRRHYPDPTDSRLAVCLTNLPLSSSLLHTFSFSHSLSLRYCWHDLDHGWRTTMNILSRSLHIQFMYVQISRQDSQPHCWEMFRSLSIRQYLSQLFYHCCCKLPTIRYSLRFRYVSLDSILSNKDFSSIIYICSNTIF